MRFKICILLMVVGLCPFWHKSAKGHNIDEIRRIVGESCQASFGEPVFSNVALIELDRFAFRTAEATLGYPKLNERESNAIDQFVVEAHENPNGGIVWSQRAFDLINVHLQKLGPGLAKDQLLNLPEVFVLTHVPAIFQSKVTRYLSEPERVQVPAISLASDASAYVLQKPLRERSNFVHYSSDGEFNFALQAEKIHFAGGAFQACLKTTVINYFNNNLLSCPTCRTPELFFHLSYIYGSDPKKMFEAVATTEVDRAIESFLKDLASVPGIVAIKGIGRERILVDRFGREIKIHFL